MVSEEQILLYYLRIISTLLIITFSLFLLYLFLLKEIKYSNSIIIIEKNQNKKSIISSNILNLNILENIILQKYLLIHSKYFKNIHYGKFILPKKNNLKDFISTISKPSNFVEKITIVEGWDKYQLNELLKKKFKKYKQIKYTDLLADTYFLHSYEDFDAFYLRLKKFKKNIELKYEGHKLLEKFTFNDLIIIGSLLEKEGTNNLDKKLIFSVIINRLNQNMKLQIDATTIFALTNGKYDLNRKLNYEDLKFTHPYNTYYINGLPPGPISYVGTKTMELIFENYKSNYLYYFFDNIVRKHIYSETFKEHKRKLSEYRSKK